MIMKSQKKQYQNIQYIHSGFEFLPSYAYGNVMRNKENYLKQNIKDQKKYYEKNKDKINMIVKAKRKLGVEFYYFCII